MSYTYYRHVFNYLARNYIPVAIHAGLEDEAGINSAMHDVSCLILSSSSSENFLFHFIILLLFLIHKE